MPRCEGRSGGVGITVACPDSRCDDSVRSRQGDLFLCDACTEARFPSTPSKKDRMPKRAPGLLESPRRKSKKADNLASSLPTSGLAGAASIIASVNDTELAAATSPTQINELLAYINFYRDRSNQEDLKKIILRHFSPNEVSEAKRVLIHTLQSFISADCQHVSDRRNSTARLAHHAELDDIIGIMNELDIRNLLSANQFSAVNFDRLPKCSPEDLNFSTVAERQQQTEVIVNELRSTIADLSPKSNDGLATASDIASTMKAVENLNDKLSKSLSDIQSQLDYLGKVYKHSIESLQSSQSTQSARSTTSPPRVVNQSHPAQSSYSSRSTAVRTGVFNQITPAMAATEIDRSRNVVIFGISEDRNKVAWQKQVSDVLAFVVGPVQIQDAFRLGHYVAGTIRPVLVRLHSVWDRRLILSNAACLRGDPKWGNVFIRPDVSLAERRLSTMKRIRMRAEQCGKLISVNDENLFIDDVLVYSISCGWVVSSDNDVRVSLFNRPNVNVSTGINNNDNNGSM